MPQYGNDASVFAGVMLPFVQGVVDHYTVGENATRVAVATFATDNTVNFHLKDHATAAAVGNT